MVQYEHLPTYKQTYDILLRTMTATKDFPREYKYSPGQKIKVELIELAVIIYGANSAQDILGIMGSFTDFPDGTHWPSTESGAVAVRSVPLPNGGIGTTGKDNSYGVRCVAR